MYTPWNPVCRAFNQPFTVQVDTFMRVFGKGTDDDDGEETSVERAVLLACLNETPAEESTVNNE